MAAFEGSLAFLAIVLSATYVAFLRMNRDVRRARMFIMADRIRRFLGAFTVGFIALAVSFAGTIVGVALPAGVSAVVILFFLGMIAYGCLELYFIVRPRRRRWSFRAKPSHSEEKSEAVPARGAERPEGGHDAPR